MDVAQSKNGVLIRLTEERWFHITENHDDLAGYYDEVLQIVEEPDYSIEGYGDALIALREVEKGKFLAVVYQEVTTDGFIVTAYFTRKVKLERRTIIWRKL